MATTAIGPFTVVMSKRIAAFSGAVSPERLAWPRRRVAFGQIWRPPPVVPRG